MLDFAAILFDLDGVIIDSEPLHEESQKAVLSRYGIEVPEAVYDQYRGKTDWDVVNHIVQTYGDGKLLVDEVLEEKQQAFRDLTYKLPLVRDADAFIRAASKRYRLALTTSSAPRNQQLAFGKFGLASFFEVVVTAADITFAKPNPEPYATTARKLGLSPSVCLVIEDSVNGVLSGVAAGCTVAGLTTSFESATLERAGAHLIVDSYRALADHLSLPLS